MDRPLGEAADEIIKSLAEAKDFGASSRAQATTIMTLGKLPYSQLEEGKKQAILLALDGRVARIEQSEDPAGCLAALTSLRTYEEISRALRYEKDTTYETATEEKFYPSDGWIGEFIDWAKYCDCPTGFLFWAAVTAIGAACRYNVYYDYGVCYPRLNLYTVLVAPPSVGKGVAGEAALEVLSRSNVILSDGWAGDNPPEVVLLPEDTNQATLVKRLKAKTVIDTLSDGTTRNRRIDSTGILYLDELATFLGEDVWQVKKLLVFLTTLYSRDKYKYETTSGGTIELRNVSLSLLACSAPDWLRSAVTPLWSKAGFMDRTLFIYREQTKRCYPVARPRDPLRGQALARWLSVWAGLGYTIEMSLTPGAMAWYEKWYRLKLKGAEDEVPEYHRTSVKRRAMTLWKVASILAISYEEVPKVSRERIQQAAAFLSHEKEYYRTFMAGLDRAPEADLEDYLVSVLYRLGKGDPVPQTRFFSAVRGKKALRERKLLYNLLDDMDKSGMIQIVKGRPTCYRPMQRT